MSAPAGLALLVAIQTATTVVGPCHKPYSPCEIALHEAGLVVERRAAACAIDRAADAKHAAADLTACNEKLKARTPEVVAAQVPCPAPPDPPFVSWQYAGVLGVLAGVVGTVAVVLTRR